MGRRPGQSAGPVEIFRVVCVREDDQPVHTGDPVERFGEAQSPPVRRVTPGLPGSLGSPLNLRETCVHIDTLAVNGAIPFDEADAGAMLDMFPDRDGPTHPSSTFTIHMHNKHYILWFKG